MFLGTFDMQLFNALALTAAVTRHRPLVLAICKCNTLLNLYNVHSMLQSPTTSDALLIQSVL